MKSLVSQVVHAWFFLTAVLMTLPVAAGEAHAWAGGKKGVSVSQRGGAGFYSSQRRLPNGVSIFNRRHHALHVPLRKGKQRKHARSSGGNVKSGSTSHRRSYEKRHAKSSGGVRELGKRAKGKQRKHARSSGGSVKSGSTSHRRSYEKRHAKSSSEGRKRGTRAKRQHKHPENLAPVYGTVVYVVRPDDEFVDAEVEVEEDCRSLTDRGYDRRGRRVLVEWTVCFDDQGHAYVPAEGRRILARY